MRPWRDGVVAAALAMALTACQAGGARPSATAAPAPAPLVMAKGVKTKPVQLARVVMKVPRSAEIGRVTTGLLCLRGADLTARGGRVDISDEAFDEAFRRTFEAANVEVVGQSDDLFASPMDGAAEVVVGALVTGLRANVCYPLGRIGVDEVQDADAAVTVNWQIYSAFDRQVVYDKTTTGSAESNASLDDAVYDAFASAARGLLADKGFRDLIVESDAIEEAAASSRRLRATVPGAALLVGTVPANMARIRPAVVTVLTAGGHGSGFFIAADGRLLTNAHVVKKAQRVKVRLADGREVEAAVLEKDARRDVALLKIAGSAPAFLPIGSSAGMIGADVYAVGSPLSEEFEATVSKGVLSSERRFEGLRYLQSDITVQPGSSGGPLLDAHGNVIGITQSGVAPQGLSAGINFFIPIEDVVAVSSAAGS